MRKTLAISFLLLANLVFLAHAMVPHHHHGNATCFATSHCDSDEMYNHNEAEHEHDHSDSSLCRVLQDVVPSEANNQKIKIEVNDFQLLLLTILPQPTQLTNIDCTEVFLTPDGYDLSLYESLIVSSQGLRAPPVC